MRGEQRCHLGEGWRQNLEFCVLLPAPFSFQRLKFLIDPQFKVSCHDKEEKNSACSCHLAEPDVPTDGQALLASFSISGNHRTPHLHSQRDLSK